MLWFIQNILFSISLIVVIHYLYIYFETTLTAPKVKDLIHCPKQKYKSLFDTINKNLDNTRRESLPHLGGENGRARQAGVGEGEGVGVGVGVDIDVNPDLDTGIGLVPKGKQQHHHETATNDVNDMRTDLKSFLRGIGLKSKSNNEHAFRPSYEMN